MAGINRNRLFAAWALFLFAGLLGTAKAAVFGYEAVSVSSDEVPSNGNFDRDSGLDISSDGRFVAFLTGSPNLVPNDTNGEYDVFVRDRLNGTTQRVSVSSAGVQANGACRYPSISDDGRFVAFVSLASNLVGGDTNDVDDVFVRDRQTNETRRVSFRSDGSQLPALGGFSYVQDAEISGNGLFVAFVHHQDLTAPFVPDSGGGVYVRDLGANVTERVSFRSDGSDAQRGIACAISRDGRFVAFDTFDIDMVAGEPEPVSLDVFVRDRQLGTNDWISRPQPYNANDFGQSLIGDISGDGRFVAFTSDRNDLVPGTADSIPDLFVRDRNEGQSERVSVSPAGVQGNNFTRERGATLSADGRFVLFESDASNLVANDTNAAPDLYLRDIQLGLTERVSLLANGQQIPDGATVPSLSEDGRFGLSLLTTNPFTGESATAQFYAAEFGDPPANRPPTANAPSDQTVKTKAARAKVRLDGSGSSDPDGDKLTYIWREGKTQIATGVRPTVRLKKGVHTITLEVRDPEGLSDTDEVVITVKKKKKRR